MLKRMMLTLAVTAWMAMPAARVSAQHEGASTGDAAHDTAAAAVEAGQAAGQTAHDSATALEHGTDATGHASAAHGGEGAEHESAPLLADPTSREAQLQALWVVIIFIVLLVILYPTAWRQVLIGLKKREQRIRQDIADAEAARDRAEQTLKEYNARLASAEGEVREMLARATSDAERVATGIRARAQQESEETRERALRDIDAARQQAVAEIYEQAATLATSVAEKILRRNLNADDQRDLVNRSLEELQTIK